MKVILLAELKGYGGEGDVVEVARGFANNYLLPRKVAIEATPGNLKQLEKRLHNIKKREEIRLAEAGDFRAVLDDKKIVIMVKVGEAGRLFGSITPVMIAEAIHEQLGVEVDRRKIETHGPIKTVGTHEVKVSVYRDIKAQLAIDVLAEGTVVEVSKAEAELAAEIEAAKAGLDSETLRPAEENDEAPAEAADEAPAEAAADTVADEAPAEEADAASANATAVALDADEAPAEAGDAGETEAQAE